MMNKTIEKYNFKEFKPVLAVSRRSLRPGQARLYDLLVKKLGSGDAVVLKEAKAIWLDKVCRNMIDGKPHTWTYNYEHASGVWRPVNTPMTKDEINLRVMDWLTKTIGILVIRGYLKAIPMVRLV